VSTRTTAVCPTSTLRAITIPSIGERIEV